MRRLLVLLPLAGLFAAGLATSALAAPSSVGALDGTAFPTATPWATAGTPLEWPTDIPITPCPMTDVPTVTPFLTVDFPTLDFPTDTGDGTSLPTLIPPDTSTPGATGTGTVTPTPSVWGIHTLYDDSSGDGYHMGPTSGGGYQVDFFPVNSRDFVPPSNAIGWSANFFVAQPTPDVGTPTATPAYLPPTVTIYYEIHLLEYHTIDVSPPPCDPEHVRTLQSLHVHNFHDRDGVLIEPYVGEELSDVDVHCESLDEVVSGWDADGSFEAPTGDPYSMWTFELYGVSNPISEAGYKFAGTVVFSLDPIPDDGPTPTPTPDSGCGVGGGYGECPECIIFDPPAPPRPGGCYVLIPSLSLDLPDDLVFVGVALPDSISVPGFQVCTQYVMLTGSLFGIDISALAVLVAGICILGVLWSIFV